MDDAETAGQVDTAWDPDRYLRHADERGRPFADLLARVRVDAATVTDLGCGPGQLMPLLRSRFPTAAITGVDSSPEMVARAERDTDDPSIAYERADVRDWRPPAPVDLVVSNATLQWVPGHLDLLPDLAGAVGPGGCLAFSVPGNHDAPSHRLLREVAAREPYATALAGREPARPRAHDPQAYLEALAGPGWAVDAWETTYLHVLPGPDPVLGWISGTGARPVLAMLGEAGLRGRFEDEYGAALRSAYPAGEHGTVLPFRRVFCVAHRDAS